MLRGRRTKIDYLYISNVLYSRFHEWTRTSLTVTGGRNVLKDRVVRGQPMSLFPSQLLSAADARFSENSRKSFLQLLHNATVVAAASGSDGSFNYKHNFSPSVNWHHQYSPPLWYFNSKGDFHTQYPWSIKSTNSPPKRNKLNINRSETPFSCQFVYFQDLDSYFVWNRSKFLFEEYWNIRWEWNAG